MIKKELIENFRKQADFIALNKLKNGDKKKQTQILNKEIKKYCELLIKEETGKYLDCSEQDNSVLLNQILLITYASYVVMLEARHKLWNYEYMSFTRRIGELWEVFCKIPFYYPLKELEIIAAPKYKKVQENFENKSFEYIDSLAIDETQKRILNLMQQNPSVSAQSLSEEIGISKRKIEENIRTLRERSKIVRIGNAKSGHWEVLD